MAINRAITQRRQALRRWPAGVGRFLALQFRGACARLVAYSMSRSARASVTMNLRRAGFICAIACNTATPSLLAATDSMARAVLLVSPLAFDAPPKPLDKVSWGDAKPLCKLDHTAGADPVGPSFVLLHLLKRDPCRRGSSVWLKHPFFSAGCATARRRVDQVRSSSSSPNPSPRLSGAILNAGLALRAAQPMKRTGRETLAEISWCFHRRCCRPRRRGSA